MNSGSEIMIFPNGDGIADFAVRQWEKLTREALEGGNEFSVALSGGTTPVLFYRMLAGSPGDIPWEKTHIFWVDERFVPPEHELSNYRLVENHLLRHVPISPGNIHPVPTALESPRSAASEYEKNIQSHFCLERGELPVFNLVVLGVGADGHTASLFPGRPSLSEKKRLALAEVSPGIAPPRVSLTLPVLNNAACVLFLVSGPGKAAVLRKVIAEKDRDLPAALVDPGAGRLFFAVDEAAASELPSSGLIPPCPE